MTDHFPEILACGHSQIGYKCGKKKDFEKLHYLHQRHKNPLSKNKYSFLKRTIFLIFSLYYQICLRMKIFLPTLWSFQLYSFIKSFPHLILFLYVKSDEKKNAQSDCPIYIDQIFFQNLGFWSLNSTKFEFPGKPKISILKKP